MKNKGTNKQQQPDSGIHDTCPLSRCVPSFNLLGLTVPEKSFVFVCVGVLRPSQQRGHLEPVS